MVVNEFATWRLDAPRGDEDYGYLRLEETCTPFRLVSPDSNTGKIVKRGHHRWLHWGTHISRSWFLKHDQLPSRLIVRVWLKFGLLLNARWGQNTGGALRNPFVEVVSSEAMW